MSYECCSHLRAGLRYALTFDCIVHSTLAGSSSHCAAKPMRPDRSGSTQPAGVVSLCAGWGEPRFVRSRLGQVFARGAAAGRTERDGPARPRRAVTAHANSPVFVRWSSVYCYNIDFAARPTPETVSNEIDGERSARSRAATHIEFVTANMMHGRDATESLTSLSRGRGNGQSDDLCVA